MNNSFIQQAKHPNYVEELTVCNSLKSLFIFCKINSLVELMNNYLISFEKCLIHFILVTLEKIIFVKKVNLRLTFSCHYKPNMTR